MNKKILFALLFSFFITEFSFSAANAVSAGAKKFGGSMAAAAAANYAATQVGAINNQVNKIPVVNQQIPGSFPPARRVQFNDQPRQSIQNITNNKFNRSVLMDNQDELQGSSGDSLLKSVIDQGSVAKALADQQRPKWKPAPPTTPYPGDRKVDDGLKSEQQVVDEINYVVPSKPAYSAPVRPAGAPGQDTSINDRIEQQKLYAQAQEKLDKQIAKNQAAHAKQFNQAERIKEDIEVLIDSNQAIFNGTNQDLEIRKIMDQYKGLLSDDASWANEPLDVKNELLYIKNEIQNIIKKNQNINRKPVNPAPARPAGAPGKDTTINDRIEQQKLYAQAQEQLQKELYAKDELNKTIVQNQAAHTEQFNQAVRIKEDIELLIDSNQAIFNETNQDSGMRQVMNKYTAILSDDKYWANEPSEVKNELLDIKKDIQNIIQSSKQKHLLEEQSVPVVNQSKKVKALISAGSDFGSVEQQNNREQYVNVIHQPIQKPVEGTMEMEEQIFKPKIKKIAEPVSHKIVYSDEEITKAFMESIAFSELIKKMFMAEYPQGV